MKMRSASAILLAIGLLPPAIASSDERRTLDELLDQIETIPDGDYGLSSGEQAYIATLLQHQDQAIPRLVELLSHPDENVAELAAATLGDCTRIDEKHLPRIIAGLDRGIGWLPRALGRVESETAAQEAVNRYLSASTSPLNQEAYAVKRHGTRAIPSIVKAATANNGKDYHVYDLLGHVLGEMDEAARKGAASALKEVLNENQTSDDLTQGILWMTARLGKAGLVLEDTLLGLRESNPELKESVDAALIGIRSEHCGQIFADLLAQRPEPDIRILRDMSFAGKAALGAGAEVLKLLDQPDWEIRRAAARTLGLIGYEEAIPKLVDLLNDPSDVKLIWISAQSLGRLHAGPAEEALALAAEQHWHPSVRAEAEKALSQIRSSTPYKDSDSLSRGVFDYEHFGMDDLPQTPPLKENQSPEKRYRTKAPEMMEPLAYDNEIVGYGASDEAEQRRIKGEDAIIEVNMENIIEHRTPIRQIPDVALRVENGWLASSNRGEWGGELVFIGDGGGKTYPILHKNIHDIHMLGKKWIAVTGLAHLTLNDGIVYELTQGEDSTWQAKLWRALPGAPRSSGQTASGEVFVATYGGGNILLSEDGSMRMAPDE